MRKLSIQYPVSGFEPMISCNDSPPLTKRQGSHPWMPLFVVSFSLPFVRRCVSFHFSENRFRPFLPLLFCPNSISSPSSEGSSIEIFELPSFSFLFFSLSRTYSFPISLYLYVFLFSILYLLKFCSHAQSLYLVDT